MAPDGSVAYFGRRQEAAWAVAAAAAAAETAAASGGTPAAVARLRAVSDRAVGRLRSAYRQAPWGLSPVPRRLPPVPPGLSPLAATRASTSSRSRSTASPSSCSRSPPTRRSGARRAGAPLPADDDGSLVIPGQGGLAIVRTGRLWFAVHARPLKPGFPGYGDLRGDVGLVALKRLADDGRWRDELPLRPGDASSLVDSAGPVLIRGGRRYPPYGERIDVRGATVRLRGGFRSARGVWARRGVTFATPPSAEAACGSRSWRAAATCSSTRRSWQGAAPAHARRRDRRRHRHRHHARAGQPAPAAGVAGVLLPAAATCGGAATARPARRAGNDRSPTALISHDPQPPPHRRRCAPAPPRSPGPLGALPRVAVVADDLHRDAPRRRGRERAATGSIEGRPGSLVDVSAGARLSLR